MPIQPNQRIRLAVGLRHQATRRRPRIRKPRAGATTRTSQPPPNLGRFRRRSSPRLPHTAVCVPSTYRQETGRSRIHSPDAPLTRPENVSCIRRSRVIARALDPFATTSAAGPPTQRGDYLLRSILDPLLRILQPASLEPPQLDGRELTVDLLIREYNGCVVACSPRNVGTTPQLGHAHRVDQS